MRIDLRKLLQEHHGSVEVDKIQEFTVEECTLTFLQLRDRLYLLGTILFEDVQNEVYVAHVRAGFGNLSGATLAMQLKGTKLIIAGYAKEGVIKQGICETAIQKVKSAAQGEEMKGSSKYPRWFAILLALITVVVLVTVRGCVFNSIDPEIVVDTLPSNSEVSPNVPESGNAESQEATEEMAFKKEVQETIEATKTYNSAVERFNIAVDQYNEAVVLTCIDNISGVPQVLEPLALESDTYEDVARAVQNGITKESIEKDTGTIEGMDLQVKELTSIVKQITVPSCEWVQDRLKRVEGVTGYQAVTLDNDPSGLLDKEGGFTDCVYFTVKEISVSSVPGKTIVEKGTDVGGAVEVYASKEEALARCDYLAGFDNTILYSGSYAVVGTMVVRTSYKLTNQQQIDLTSSITSAMLEIE